MMLVYQAKLCQLKAPVVHSSTSERHKQTSNQINNLKETEGKEAKNATISEE